MKSINIIFFIALLSGIFALNTNQDDMAKMRNDVNFLLSQSQRKNFMYTDEILVHQDIYSALQRGVIEKSGSPDNWLDNYPVWNKRNILRFGIGRITANDGLKVNVPEGYNVLWVRILNDRWFHMRVKYVEDKEQGEIEKYASGFRNLNEYSPDGAAPDTQWTTHMWMQIPLRMAGAVVLTSEVNSDSWISGIAFGKNLWNHARNSAVAYHWAINGGEAMRWHTHNWNNDQLCSLNAGAIRVLRVPVIPNGRDKMVYLVEHNNNWVGTMHGEVWIGTNRVDRFRTSWNNNPFATHYNGKMYDRYMATIVPANLIQPTDKFIELRVDMSMSDHHIHIREAGTHDSS
jgi:hypothetical protein